MCYYKFKLFYLVKFATLTLRRLQVYAIQADFIPGLPKIYNNT